jgi:phosphohistidine phosphatase
MRLTLLRHARAMERDDWRGDDADRPLTKDGVRQATRVLRGARALITAVEIWTSPWLRARQTAELASGLWKLPLREMDWLAGEACPSADRAARLQANTDVVLVGHEPDLSDLARFLCGAQLVLKKASLAVLEGQPRRGTMKLQLLLGPKQALALLGQA